MSKRDERPSTTPVERLRAVAAALPPELQPPPPDSPAGRILEAAREILALEGIESLSVRAVAERAGVNLAMIHYYFGSKEGLIQALVRREILSVMRDVVGGLDPALEGPDLFARFPVRMLEVMRGDPLRPRLVRAVFAGAPQRLAAAIAELGPHGILGTSRVVMDLIAETQEAGRLRGMSPRSVLLFLLANVYGLVLLEPVAREILGFALEDEAQWAEHRGNLQRLVRDGLAAPAAEEEDT